MLVPPIGGQKKSQKKLLTIPKTADILYRQQQPPPRKRKMFNAQQIADAIATIDAKGGPTLYTPQKNHEAYMLYHYPKSGVACENLVFQTMLQHGLQADWVGDDDSHDISLYVGGRLVRVEVKSSVMHGTPARFKFHGIKPEKFDLLVLVFIHPTEGTVVKTCRKSDVENWM